VDLDQRRCYCENSSSHGSGEERHGDDGQHLLGNALSNAYRYIRQLSVFDNDEKKYEPYNILEKAADFSNDFGSTAAAGENDFELLGTVDKGIFMVKLKAVFPRCFSFICSVLFILLLGMYALCCALCRVYSSQAYRFY
jgi:hypothetical protein